MQSVLAAVTAACLVLTACGGGGDDIQTPNTPPAGPSCAPRTVTVALLGDSTQYGYDGFTKTRAVPNPGELLQAEMDARFGAGAVIVTDYGVGGSTADQAPRVEADVVVENYGINDEGKGHSLEQYHADIAAIAPTIVETQNPVRAWPIEDQAAYVAAAKLPGVPVADVFSYVTSLPNWPSMIDWLHPGEELYALISKNVLAPVVAEQVAALRCPA